MELCKKYMDLYESLPKWLKIILTLLYAIPEGLYRIAKSVMTKKVLNIVLTVLIVIFGGLILFIIDIITLVLKDKIYCLEDIL